MRSWIDSSRQTMESDLRAYGEDVVADKFASSPDDYVRRIQERAFEYACQIDAETGKPTIIAKSLALAAVELIEGTPRRLQRKRRRLTKNA